MHFCHYPANLRWGKRPLFQCSLWSWSTRHTILWKNGQYIIFGVILPSSPLGSLVVNLAVTGSPTKCPWTVLVWYVDFRGPQTCINYLICTVAKKGCVRICVSLATLSIIPRVVKPPPIWCGLATVPIFVADFQHLASITWSTFGSACLGGNAGHMRTWGTG